MKQCSKCGKKKHLDAFKTDRRKPDGRAARCKACVAADNAEWRKQNPGAEKRRTLPRNPIRRSAEGILRLRRASAKWRRENKERHRALDKAWRTSNPEKASAIKAARRARKKNVGGRHTGNQLKALLVTQKWKCANCRTSIRKKRHVDHIQPIALGGSNDIKNIQLLCPRCNLAKRSKHPLVWARENGRLL